jgi:hypothetical protein
MQEYKKMLNYYWDAKRIHVGLRARADLLLTRNFVARSELTRLLMFSHCGVQDLPDEGVRGAKAFRVAFKQSKTNQYGKIEQAGCMR